MKAYVELEGEQEVTLDWLGQSRTFTVAFTAKGSAHYSPAQLGGPPERCCPEESELNLDEILITQVLNEDGAPVQALPALASRLRSGLNEHRISDLMWDAAWDNWNDRDA